MTATKGGPVISRISKGISPPRMVTAQKPRMWPGPQSYINTPTKAVPNPAAEQLYDALVRYNESGIAGPAITGGGSSDNSVPPRGDTNDPSGGY